MVQPGAARKKSNTQNANGWWFVGFLTNYLPCAIADESQEK